MARDRHPTEAAQWLTCAFNAALLAGAVAVVAAEGLDLDRDGAFTAHEAVLVPVRLLAFPVHLLLQLTPAPMLHLLGLPPDAPWPASAAVAVAPGLPLWGVLVLGVLVLEAWLGMAWEAGAGRRARRAGARRTPPAAP